jgi:hypothetical protein
MATGIEITTNISYFLVAEKRRERYTPTSYTCELDYHLE